ncbi:MAG: alkaline phosphatase family protein [Sphingobacteriales bacterium]|nr:alkaline phosphatase family protein [Sphingobacteriales bacterium]
MVELVDLPVYPFFIDLGYYVLGNKEPFKTFKASVPILATWDDHDYGYNNGGKEFPHKTASKNSFMKFWNISPDSPMRSRGGVHNAYYYGEGEFRVQIILLDTRWFLDVISREPITATRDTSKHILGEEEWQWLEQELRKPARIRIIGSSTQFGIEHNGYEAWANYPHEMDRFFNLIKSTRAEGLFFVSGDVHYAEISRRAVDGLYPIFDVTSSGLTQLEGSSKPNMFRVGDSFTDFNFGMIHINWNDNPVTISQEIYDINGNVRIQNKISINDLKF